MLKNFEITEYFGLETFAIEEADGRLRLLRMWVHVKMYCLCFQKSLNTVLKQLEEKKSLENQVKSYTLRLKRVSKFCFYFTLPCFFSMLSRNLLNNYHKIPTKLFPTLYFNKTA